MARGERTERGECVDSRWFLGVDIAKAQDHSAVVGVERGEWLEHAKHPETWQRAKYRTLDVRLVQRWPRGLAYPELVERIVGVVGRAEFRGGVDLVVDASGVGAAVADYLVRQLPAHVALVPVVITGAALASPREVGGWNVPKADLVASVQIALQAREMRIARSIPEAGALLAELANFRSKETDAGGVRYEAEGRGHDDIVLAAALAIWRTKPPRPKVGRRIGHGRGRIPGVSGTRPDEVEPQRDAERPQLPSWLG